MKKLEEYMTRIAVVLFLGRFAYLTCHRLVHPDLWNDWTQDPRIGLAILAPALCALIYEILRGKRIRRTIANQQEQKTP